MLTNNTRKSSYQDLNHFNFHSIPIPALELPQKINILSLEISQHGNGGVIFIQIQEGSFVVKPNYNIPFQIFYNQVAKQVGMRVPAMQIFSIEDKTHQLILSGVKKFCGSRDQIVFYRIKNKFSQLFYAILEYIPAVGFQNIGKQRYQRILTKPERLHQIGVCLGFDLMINNNDRFKLLWMGQGNIQNVLINVPKFYQNKLDQIRSRNNVSIQLGSYVFIDNTGNIFNSSNTQYSKQIKIYLQKVNQFLRQCLIFTKDFVRQSDGLSKFMESKYLKNFLDHIELYTQYRLNEKEIYEIVLGIFDGIENFLCKYKNGEFAQILENTKLLSKNIIFEAELWVKQLNKVNLKDYDLFQELIRPIIKEFHSKEIKRKENPQKRFYLKEETSMVIEQLLM